MPNLVRWLLELCRPRRTPPVVIRRPRGDAGPHPSRAGRSRTVDAEAERRYELPLDFR